MWYPFERLGTLTLAVDVEGLDDAQEGETMDEGVVSESEELSLVLV